MSGGLDLVLGRLCKVLPESVRSCQRSKAWACVCPAVWSCAGVLQRTMVCWFISLHAQGVLGHVVLVSSHTAEEKAAALEVALHLLV